MGPDVLVRLCHTYLLPKQPLFWGNTSARSQLQALGQTCALQPSTRFWRYTDYTVRKCPQCSPGKFRYGCRWLCLLSIPSPLSSLQAWLNKWSWQKTSSGGSKVGMGSGNIWEQENEKQVWPGKGYRVLLHSTGEQDRLKKEWLEGNTALFLSHVCKRRHCLQKGFLKISCGLRCKETGKEENDAFIKQ